eukprot:108184-Amphidinium_carterae.2
MSEPGCVFERPLGRSALPGDRRCSSDFHIEKQWLPMACSSWYEEGSSQNPACPLHLDWKPRRDSACVAEHLQTRGHSHAP